MNYFLDTNICIYYLKGSNPEIRKNLLSKRPDQIKIPVITKAELLYGAEKSVKKNENREKIHDFLFPFEIIPFTDSDTHIYAAVRAELEGKGRVIGPNDLLIASIVLSRDGILITHNRKEFETIEQLNVENWME